jgi:eukaryotic-like serine/threonine-protein kinase
MDESSPEFPSYAALTQTREWGSATAKVAMSPAAEITGERYTESAVLGTGGMGKVLLARDARIGRDVAVKVLHGERELSDRERARFLREAQVQGQLEHPSIVPVYDIDHQPDGSIFFTMRRVLGKTLQVIIDDLRTAREHKHTQRELLQAFATVCLAIDYAHSRGVVHRDLKPANIMLGDFGEVYVLDWGVARVLESSGTELSEPAASRLSSPGMNLGTPLYMAPEQVADPEVDTRADVFALGAILFEILTYERLRFPRALHAPIEARPSVRAPHLSIAPELESICVKATRDDPDERYPTARALQEAVARYLEGDREIEQRKALAAEHAARARIALASDQQHEDLAMLELARALALEPTNVEHVAMMAEVLRTPPQTTPPEVSERIAAAAEAHVRDGSRHAGVAVLSWLLFVPLVFLLGVRRLDYVIVGAVIVVLTGGLAAVAIRQHIVARPVQYALIAANTLTCILLTRLFGPLILVPTLLATWAIVMMVHPERPLRVFGLAAALAGIVLPVMAEVMGLLPASYGFDGVRGFEVLPQMTELPEVTTLVFLTLAGAAATIVPCSYVARLRAALAESQKRELMQTYRLRRLGDNMLRA